MTNHNDNLHPDRARIAEIRAAYRRPGGEQRGLTLDEIEFLLPYAFDWSYEASVDEVAANVRRLVAGADYEPLIRHLPGGPPPAPPPAPKVVRMGAATIVDLFACDRDPDVLLRVSRAPGAGPRTIACPVCEQDMVRFERKLAAGAPPETPRLRWSPEALRTGAVHDGEIDE